MRGLTPVNYADATLKGCSYGSLCACAIAYSRTIGAQLEHVLARTDDSAPTLEIVDRVYIFGYQQASRSGSLFLCLEVDNLSALPSTEPLCLQLLVRVCGNTL